MLEAALHKDDLAQVQVLVLEGDFTLDEKSEVEGLLADAAACEYAGVVMDLSGIRYIDSAGLMVVIATFNRLQRAGKSLVVATGGNPYATSKLREIGFLSVPEFRVFESVESAKAALVEERS